MKCFPKANADCGTKCHPLVLASVQAMQSSTLGEVVSISLTGKGHTVLGRAHELPSQ